LPIKRLDNVEVVIPNMKRQLEIVQLEKTISIKNEQLIDKFSEQTQFLSLLRQSILQEAIQGKLTAEWRKQNPNAEPAVELLKRIKAEKEQLIKEKKIKKEKPLLPITGKNLPFELPEGWAWCRLGDNFSSTSGGTPNRANVKYWNGKIQWYKSGELNDGLLEKESEEKITELGYKESSATLFPKGTLLIAMYGATAGKLSILNRDATTNQAVCGFFENGILETKYLFYFLMANRNKMIEDSWGMSQPNISQTYLRNFVYALPPLEEQQAIVSKLETLLAKCDRLQVEIENMNRHNKELLRALFNETFEGGK
jgi:type I restriction enzyme S subunit